LYLFVLFGRRRRPIRSQPASKAGATVPSALEQQPGPGAELLAELTRTRVGGRPTLDRFFVDAALATEDFETLISGLAMELAPQLPLAPEGGALSAVTALLVCAPHQAVDEAFTFFVS
jgi:hypothetical protein